MRTVDNETGGRGRERRQFTRVPGHAVPALTARVVGGAHVRLLDVSRRGARVETTLPLRPGRAVTIRFIAADTTVTLTGAVVRSSVAILTGDDVTYHSGLSFSEDVVPFRLTDDRPADSVDSGETDDMIMVVSAPRETGDGLRERLLATT